MSLAKAQMYRGKQIGYGEVDSHPDFNPNAKARAWKIDFSLFPGAEKTKIEAKKVPLSDRYDDVKKAYKLDAEDANVTDTEFATAASLKPVIPA